MSRRRSRLSSTAIAGSSAQIVSVGEFLKGLHRTPRKSRNKTTQINTPSTAATALLSPQGNQEDGFLLETLAALEAAEEGTARPIAKRELRKSAILGARFQKKRRKKHHVSYNSLVLSRDPQNERSLYSSEAQDSDPDPIVSGITQTDNPILLKPRFPVSVIRGSLVSPWSQRGRNLAAAAGRKESRVISRGKENWGDRIDSLLVPGKIRTKAIRGKTPPPEGALELVNVADRAESPTGTNKFPHFVSFDSQLAAPNCSPFEDQGLVGVELGPKLGFFQAPQVNTESKRPTVAVHPVSQHFKRICTINSKKSLEQTNKVTDEDHATKPPLDLGASGPGPDSWGLAEAQGDAMDNTSPLVSPGLIGSGVTAEKGGQGGSMAKPLGYPWERYDRGPTPFPSPEPGIAPEGSDCSSLLRFWESRLSKSSLGVSLPGDIEVRISPVQELESSPQFRAEGGTKKPSLILEEEVGEGNFVSPSAQLWKDNQLAHQGPASPPNQPPRVILESPISMPRSDQPGQARVEQVMPPPPLRQPRNHIGRDKREDDTAHINEIPRKDYFLNAQKILNNYEDARLTVPPIRSDWKANTIATKAQLGSENVHRAQPQPYSLCPLSAPTPTRTYSTIPLKDIIKRRQAVPLRRPTISGSFKSPFLPKPQMTNMDQAFIPITSGFTRQGQEDRTMSVVNPSPSILPASTVPPTFVAEPKSRAKRRVTESQSFPPPTSLRAPKIGPRRATQAVLQRPHRGMTVRFEPSQKPFKPPLVTKSLEPTLGTSRRPSGFDTIDDSAVLVNPGRKATTKEGTRSGQGKVGVGAQCAGMNKVATSSFAEVQAAW